VDVGDGIFGRAWTGLRVPIVVVSIAVPAYVADVRGALDFLWRYEREFFFRGKTEVSGFSVAFMSFYKAKEKAFKYAPQKVNHFKMMAHDNNEMKEG
jgi:hypothetical protein